MSPILPLFSPLPRLGAVKRLAVVALAVVLAGCSTSDQGPTTTDPETTPPPAPMAVRYSGGLNVTGLHAVGPGQYYDRTENCLAVTAQDAMTLALEVNATWTAEAAGSDLLELVVDRPAAQNASRSGATGSPLHYALEGLEMQAGDYLTVAFQLPEMSVAAAQPVHVELVVRYLQGQAPAVEPRICTTA